jgi:hypothetical protein
VFVTDGQYQRVQEFTPGGVYIRTFKDTIGDPGSNSTHYGIAFNLAGDELYSCIFQQNILRRAVTEATTEEVFSVAFDTTDFNVTYDGSGGVFVGRIPKPLDDATDVLVGQLPAPDLADGDVLRYDATSELWLNHALGLSDLADTAISSPVTGQVPVWNATAQQWENQYAPGVIGIYQDSNYTGSNSSSAQKLFNESANGAANIPAAGTYRIKMAGRVHTTGTNSHSFSLLFGGTATVAAFGAKHKQTQSATAGGGTEGAIWMDDVTASAVWAAVATITYNTFEVDGLVRFSGAGTFIPQFKYSATPGAAPTIAKESFCELTPIGTSTVTTVGSWS